MNSQECPTYRDPDSFDFRSAMLSVTESARRHKWLVLVTCLVTLALTTAYVVLFQPIYAVRARVMVEKTVDDSRNAFYTQWNVFRKDDPRTEIELMTSPSLVARVVKKEHLKYNDVYHPLLSQVSRLWRNSLPGRTYHDIKGRLFPKEVDPDAPTPEQIEFAETVTDMLAGIKVQPVADSSIGEMTVKGPTRRVARIANTLVSTYLEERAMRFRAEAQKNLDALENETILASKEASNIADQRLAFLQANSLSFDLSKESQQLTKLVELEDGIAANRAKQASLRASLDLVRQQLVEEPVTKTSSITTELNSIRESAKIKTLELETGLVSLRSVYREDSPEVKEVLRNMAELDRIIQREPEKIEKLTTSTLNSTRQDLILSRNSLQSQLDGLEGGLKVMEQTQMALRARINVVPGLQNKLREFDRQFALANDRYQALSAKRAQAAVSRAMAVSAAPSMQIVQEAAPPDDPAWPKLKILYPSALLVGLVLGVIAAQIRSLTSNRVTRSYLENASSSSVYGTIRIPIGVAPFATPGTGGKGRSDRGRQWKYGE